MRRPYLLVLLPALVGAVLGAIAYFNPDSGVDGTVGALLALVGAVAVTLASLLAMMPRIRGWGLGLLNLALGLGAALTAVATYFLMQYPFAAAMALAFAGLIPVILSRSDRRVA